MNSTGASQTSYLRFNVSGLTRPVQSAKLRLYVTNASDQGGAIYSVANTYLGTATPWTETGLNWGNAPAIGGPALSSIAAAAVNTWVEFDVTAALAGNGTYSFGLHTLSTNDVRYSSKEAANNQPQLAIQQVAAPALENFAPTSGKAGSEVLITGTGFVGATGVTFGGVPASNFTVDSNTQIRAIVPAGAISGKVVVTTAAGTTASVADFDVTQAPPAPTPPTITAFAPASGKAGTEVTITGARFTGATNVTFGGVQASSFTVDSDTQIRAIVPAGATSGNIRVVTAVGAASSTASFDVTLTVSPPPRLIYVPLAMAGNTNAVASGSSAEANTKALYSAFRSDWRDAGSPRTFVCLFDL
jgi:hypothetical protein